MPEEQFKEFKDGVLRALEKFEAKLDAVGEDLREVRECQIKHEAHFNGDSYHKMLRDFEKMGERIAVLESNVHKQSGVAVALEWVYKLGPWLLITALAGIEWWRASGV